MAKGDYYFPLFYKRLLVSTIGWKDDQFGAYLRLLIHQFDNGSIPSDMKDIIRIAPSAKKHWPLLSKKFTPDGKGGLINEVMDEIYHDIQTKKETNSKNGKLGGRKKRTVNPNQTERLTVRVSESEAIPIINNQESRIKEREEPPTHILKTDSQWNSKPGPDEPGLDLTEVQVGSVIEYFRITKYQNASADQVQSLWRIFKVQNLTGEKWYPTKGEVFSHFLNWCKTQNLPAEKKGNNHAEADSIREQKANKILEEVNGPNKPK